MRLRWIVLAVVVAAVAYFAYRVVRLKRATDPATGETWADAFYSQVPVLRDLLTKPGAPPPAGGIVHRVFIWS